MGFSLPSLYAWYVLPFSSLYFMIEVPIDMVELMSPRPPWSSSYIQQISQTSPGKHEWFPCRPKRWVIVVDIVNDLNTYKWFACLRANGGLTSADKGSAIPSKHAIHNLFWYYWVMVRLVQKRSQNYVMMATRKREVRRRISFPSFLFELFNSAASPLCLQRYSFRGPGNTSCRNGPFLSSNRQWCIESLYAFRAHKTSIW